MRASHELRGSMDRWAASEDASWFRKRAREARLFSGFLLIFAATEEARASSYAEIIGDQKQIQLFKAQYALINRAASHDVIVTPRDLLFFDERRERSTTICKRLIRRDDILGPKKRPRITIAREERRQRRRSGFRSRPRGVKDPRRIYRKRAYKRPRENRPIWSEKRLRT